MDKIVMTQFFELIKTVVDNYMKNRKPSAVLIGTYTGTAVMVGRLPVPMSMISGNMVKKLAPGDKVRLLRNDGGHEYYILEIVDKPYQIKKLSSMALTIDLTVKEQSYIDRTYKMSDTQIAGFVDGMEALKQSNSKLYRQSNMNTQSIVFSMGLHGNS